MSEILNTFVKKYFPEKVFKSTIYFETTVSKTTDQYKAKKAASKEFKLKYQIPFTLFQKINQENFIIIPWKGSNLSETKARPSSPITIPVNFSYSIEFKVQKFRWSTPREPLIAPHFNKYTKCNHKVMRILTWETERSLKRLCPMHEVTNAS